VELLNSNLGRRDRDDELFKWVASTPIETVRPLLRADPAYLDAAFAHMERVHGGAMNFIRKELGVDDRALGAIRKLLLRSWRKSAPHL